MPGVQRVTLADADHGARIGSPLIHVAFEASSPAGGTGTARHTAASTVSDIPSILVNNGFRLTKFTEEAVNLETAFMRLTKGLVQ